MIFCACMMFSSFTVFIAKKKQNGTKEKPIAPLLDKKMQEKKNTSLP
jgi:hypothetical protein